LTYFLIDLQSDGVTVAPIRRLDGRPSFGQIFFDDVWVPDIDVLGAVGMGWKVAMSTAGSERGFSLRSPSRFRVAAEKLLARVILANDACPAGVVEEAVDAYLDAEAYELRTLWAASELMAGRSLGAEMSCDKLFWSDLDIRLSDLSLSLRYLTGLGTERARASLTEELNTYVTALPGTIWGGTDEIQRDIVAQRVLGLPRSER
jgi:alkylation response protein AidB-like acyl-CoA dehydrogenase